MCRRSDPHLASQCHASAPRRGQDGHRTAGVALIIVLVFVLLLSGVIIAFFSHSTNELQISNSSVNQVKADLLAQGALDTVVGDFKQEILAGSVSPAPTPAAGVTLYVPKAPLNAVPARDPALAGKAGYENLIKRSSTAASYVNSTSNQAAGPSTLAPALNGQYLSSSRWNYHLLLQKDASVSTNAGVFTPTGATATTWAFAPEWVVVKRTEDLGNPTTQWSNTLTAQGSNPVVGRYAYAVYDEGGLLDINAAGYPSPLTNTQYKSSLAFADLKQLPGISTLGTGASNASSLNQDKLIDNLIGLRNYASAAYNPTTQASTPINGNFPAFTWSAANAANYFNFFQFATHGFLTAANVPLVTTPKSVTDHPFLTRQEFLRIALQYITTTEADRASVEDAFQYLGTFSRAYNQPSLIRKQSVDQSAVGYDSSVPKVLATTAGGNNAVGLDAAINPSFLTARVKTVFTRNDGTSSVVGEPLVKQRFALNQIAWLTCQGPIADDSGNFAGNTMTQSYVTAYENTYGLSDQFLKQGGPKNIRIYFGLAWDNTNKRWSYVNGRNGTSGPILKLNYPGDSSDVARAGRDADFFELLKATINVGAIAKTSTPPTTSISTAYQRQYNVDSSVDFAIMQIGANIIDQFDVDGYPTRILFNDGSSLSNLDSTQNTPTTSGAAGGTGWEIRGVENLPYINRARLSMIKVAAPTLTSGGTPYGGTDYPGDNGTDTSTITNTGVGAMMEYPELWNPHDWNTTTLDPNYNRTLGVAGPTNFRIYATTDTAYALIGSDGGSSFTNRSDTKSNQALSPGYGDKYGFPWAGEQRSLDLNNTEMDFSIPRSTVGVGLFREPTVLFQPGKPTGSDLASAAIGGQRNLGALGGRAAFFNGGGIASAVTATDDTVAPVFPTAGTGYLGFYIGSNPLQWIVSSGSPLVNHRFGMRQTGILGTLSMHYYLQAMDANGVWATYDEKFEVLTAAPNDHIMRWPDGGFIHVRGKGLRAAQAVDPRSSRFNFVSTFVFNGYSQWEFPPFEAGATPWINKSEGILNPHRNGVSSGANVINPSTVNPPEFFPLQMGWYPGGWDTGANANGTTLRLGMFTQNNTRSAPDGREFDGAPTRYTGTSPGPAQYYADPDGVVRLAMGGLVEGTPAASSTGLPMTTANADVTTRNAQNDSRPLVLNRPFRSVEELGYVFSGTPWKNLSFATPDSGYTALMDVFTTHGYDAGTALEAGRVNLNTRQAPVLQAILAGAYKDEWNSTSSTLPGGTGQLAAQLANKLVARTNTGTPPKPLGDLTELVGSWQSAVAATSGGGIDGSKSYDGFSADLTNVLTSTSDVNIGRFREASLRALASTGQTRVWNLLIDLVAQTGRYPQNATGFSQFAVDGEQRCWLHVAIDRLTGEVIDKQLEIVKE